MNLRKLLAEAIDRGVVSMSNRLAVIRLFPELYRELPTLECYSNDHEVIKSKSKIVAMFCRESSHLEKYDPDDIKEALTILKSLGGDIKYVDIFYNEDFPAIVTIYKMLNFAIIVAPEHWENFNPLMCKKLSEIVDTGEVFAAGA
ncbi:hypothetical protein ACO3VM_02850 [Methanocaldococcus sp. 10A]